MTSYRLTGPLRGTDLAEAWIVDGTIRHSAPDGPAQTVAGWAYPGLVDAHAHPGLSYSAEPVADAEVIRRLDAARAAGVTTVREMGAQLDVARFAARGRTKAIRSGRHIARPKRYIRNVAAEIEPRELPDEVVRQAARGDGWVKLVGDWIDRAEGADSDLRPLWPRDVLADAVAASPPSSLATVVMLAPEAGFLPLAAREHKLIRLAPEISEDRLLAAVDHTLWADTGDISLDWVWIALESDATKAVRRHLVASGMSRRSIQHQAYWIRGRAMGVASET